MQRSREAARGAVNLAGLQDLFESVCRDAIEATRATRASIWYFEANGSIVCQYMFDRRKPGFERGATIGREHHADYLDTLVNDGIVAAENARSHPATSCFVDEYFVPNDIHALLDIMIPDAYGRPAAVLCCEQCGAPRPWSERNISALHGLTALISSTLRYQGGSAAQRALLTPSLPFADQPLLMEAALYWSAKRSSRPMPLVEDISSLDLPRPLLPNLLLVDIESAPFRARYHAAGSEIRARLGRDLIGYTVDDIMSGDYCTYLLSLYRSVYDSAQPVYSESTFKWNDGGANRTHRLLLPLSRQRGEAGQCRVDMVMAVQVWPDDARRIISSPSRMTLRPDLIDNSTIASLALPAFRHEA